ncbi:MAG: hypothetical protein DRN53_05175 [Thermoprotei archaeon]|nr:MAG: hypothetical protein DRN53_05175 [Thermoprotei archaeon]
MSHSPIYMVTVRPGREEKCLMDLRDAIFPLDREVRVERTEISGVLLIKSTLNFRSLVGLLVNKPIRHLMRVIKLEEVTNIGCYEDLLRKIRTKLPRDKNTAIEIELRGKSKSISSRLKLCIKEYFKDIRICGMKNADIVLLIEGIGSLLGYSIYSKDEYRLTRISSIYDEIIKRVLSKSGNLD